jgi:hypothetical protein
MTSRFSNVSKTSKQNAKFKKHNVHEVATSLTEAKNIANDLSETKRYAYRAKATLVGHASVRPYDPIYLDGLPNGMSGYWTVLSVTHIFNGSVGKYMMEVEVGTDILGDENPDAKFAKEYRDVAAEFAGQSLTVSTSQLNDYSFSVNSSPLQEDHGEVTPSVMVTPIETKAPIPDGLEDIYLGDIPDFSAVKRTTEWVATNPGTVIK